MLKKLYLSDAFKEEFGIISYPESRAPAQNYIDQRREFTQRPELTAFDSDYSPWIFLGGRRKRLSVEYHALEDKAGRPHIRAVIGENLGLDDTQKMDEAKKKAFFVFLEGNLYNGGLANVTVAVLNDLLRSKMTKSGDEKYATLTTKPRVELSVTDGGNTLKIRESMHMQAASIKSSPTQENIQDSSLRTNWDGAVMFICEREVELSGLPQQQPTRGCYKLTDFSIEIENEEVRQDLQNNVNLVSDLVSVKKELQRGDTEGLSCINILVRLTQFFANFFSWQAQVTLNKKDQEMVKKVASLFKQSSLAPRLENKLDFLSKGLQKISEVDDFSIISEQRIGTFLLSLYKYLKPLVKDDASATDFRRSGASSSARHLIEIVRLLRIIEIFSTKKTAFTVVGEICRKILNKNSEDELMGELRLAELPADSIYHMLQQIPNLDIDHFNVILDCLELVPTVPSNFYLWLEDIIKSKLRGCQSEDKIRTLERVAMKQQLAQANENEKIKISLKEAIDAKSPKLANNINLLKLLISIPGAPKSFHEEGAFKKAVTSITPEGLRALSLLFLTGEQQGKDLDESRRELSLIIRDYHYQDQHDAYKDFYKKLSCKLDEVGSSSAAEGSATETRWDLQSFYDASSQLSQLMEALGLDKQIAQSTMRRIKEERVDPAKFRRYLEDKQKKEQQLPTDLAKIWLDFETYDFSPPDQSLDLVKYWEEVLADFESESERSRDRENAACFDFEKAPQKWWGSGLFPPAPEMSCGSKRRITDDVQPTLEWPGGGWQ